MDPAQQYFDCIPPENKHKLDWKLDHEHGGVQKHLGAIANAMDEWRGDVAEALGLSKVEIADINSRHNCSLGLQTRAVLQKWRERNGYRATYRALIKAFLGAGKPDFAEAVCKVLGGTPGQTNGASVPTDTTPQHPSAGSKDQGNVSTNQLQPNSSTMMVKDPEARPAGPPATELQVCAGTTVIDPFFMFIECCKLQDKDREVLKDNGMTCNGAFVGSSEKDLLEMEDESGNKLTNGCRNALKYYLLQQNACHEQVRSHDVDPFLEVIESCLCKVGEKDKKILEENGFTCKEAFVGLSQQDFLKMTDSCSGKPLTIGCKNVFKCHLLPQDIYQKEVPKRRVDPDGDQSGKDNSGQMTMDGNPNQDKCDQEKTEELESILHQQQSGLQPVNQNYDQLNLGPESEGFLEFFRSPWPNWPTCYAPYPRGLINPTDGDRRPLHTPKLKLHSNASTVTEVETWAIQEARSLLIHNYPMKSRGVNGHGVALLINNKNFTEHNTRNGTERDEENVVEMLRFLGYRVQIRRECTKKDIEDLFDKINSFIKDEDDSFVCCILSHGCANVVYGSDSRKVFLRTKEDSLEKKLAADKCPKLKGKPKIFFLSTCREQHTASTVGTQTEPEPDPELEPDPVPETEGNSRSRSDFSFNFATLSGETAFRYRDTGNVYIRELCHVMCQYATMANLSDLQKKVTLQLKQGRDNQVPAFAGAMSQNVYFFDDFF